MSKFEEIVSGFIELLSETGLAVVTLNLVVGSMIFYLIDVMFTGGV